MIKIDMKINKKNDNENYAYIYDENNILKNKIQIKDINFIQDTTNLTTRLFMNGKNNISIVKYNPTGQEYVDDFSYYIDHDYFNESLTDGLNKYNNLIENKRVLFEEYMDELNNGNNNVLLLIKDIRDSLLWENNFTQSQIDELKPFINEKFEIITEISDERQLYEYAVKHLKTISFVPIQITMKSIDDFLFEKDYSLELENMIKSEYVFTIHYKPFDLIYKDIKLISCDRNSDNNSLILKFSNTNKDIDNQSKDFEFINTVYNSSIVE